MPMYNSIEYSDNYSKTSGTLWQYYKDEQPLDNNGNVVDFAYADHESNFFKYKHKITSQAEKNGTKDVKIMLPLKYISNFWRALEISLISSKINLLLTWSKKCDILS